MSIESREMEFIHELAELYLKYGSVEEALKHNPHLPVSVPEYHRIIRKVGIVKGTGRSNVSIAEVLHFFATKTLEPEISLEGLYRKMHPYLEGLASIGTLHRIYEQVQERMVRTYATALILTSNDPTQILVADEKMQHIGTGKIKGKSSILMGFGTKGEENEIAVLRVMQREFSTSLTLSGDLTIDSEMTKKIIQKNIEPFMFLRLLDVEVAVYTIAIPDELTKYAASYKMTNHRFISLSEILDEKNKGNFRLGVKEMIEGYQSYRFGLNPVPFVKNALINEDMLAFTD